MVEKLEKNIVLQEGEAREGVTQFKVTLPKMQANYLGWTKGDVLTATVIAGTGQLVLEKAGLDEDE